MNSKSLILNFAGFSRWPQEWQAWMLKVARTLPTVEVVVFGYDKDHEDLKSVPSVRSFDNAVEMTDWLGKNCSCLVNLVPRFEPEVSPVPTLLMLPVFRPSPFWSPYMPNSFTLYGDALVELGRRPNCVVSNSRSLLELLKVYSHHQKSSFFEDSFEELNPAKVQKWIDAAIEDFANSPKIENSPLVSVVTPSFNQAQYLSRTLESVRKQIYPRIEYFVIDGGSTDGTVEILTNYSGNLQWVSEKDSGYPEAVNKGFQKCHGKYLMWLPSDDTLFSESSISQLVAVAEETGADVVFGDAFYIDEDDRIIGSYRTTEFTPERLREWCLVCQPAALFRADTYRRVGGLDQGFRCISDYDLWLKMADAGARFERLGRPLSCYRIHSQSLTVKQKRISYREIFDLQLARYGSVRKPWVLGAFKEIVLNQNLSRLWARTRSAFPTKPKQGHSIRRRLKQWFEDYLATKPFFQKLIRQNIEDRPPRWPVRPWMPGAIKVPQSPRTS